VTLAAQSQSKEKLEKPVISVMLVQRKSVMNYSFDQMGNFLRIVTALPSLVATARRTLEQGMTLPGGGSHCFETFESNWLYVLRFMVDREVVGMNWLSLPSGKWRQRPWQSANGKTVEVSGQAQLEVDISFGSLVSHPTEGEWEGMAPVRILSFDIECAGRPGVFPDAEKDEIIQIANHVCLQGTSVPILKNVFTLDTCSPISGATVLSFADEGEMLKAWHKFVVETDADIITGYNIINFDLPYLLTRAQTLKIKSFPYLGRIKGMPTRMKDKVCARLYRTCLWRTWSPP